MCKGTKRTSQDIFSKVVTTTKQLKTTYLYIFKHYCFSLVISEFFSQHYNIELFLSEVQLFDHSLIQYANKEANQN